MNLGATWEASSSDGTRTRAGVMSFVATNANGISVPDSTVFDAPTGTVTFWMRSAGTDTSTTNGAVGAALFCRPLDSSSNEVVLVQEDGAPGTLLCQAGSGIIGYNTFTSTAGVSDDKWHFVALTLDQSSNGAVALYIDGALNASNPNPGAWSWPTGQPLEIGYSTDLAWRDYNGSLNDVRYYSAVLTASQIASIYNTGALVDTTDLQFQFQFIAAPGTGIMLNWKETPAVLQSAPSLEGPWTDLPGVTSPYVVVPAAPQQYFRYRYVPQSLVSNPYLM